MERNNKHYFTNKCVDMNIVYLLTGSNLANRLQHLQKAIQLIEANIGQVLEQSAIYETDPWGKEDQPSFLNQVLAIKTGLSPQEILKKIHVIEYFIGRRRNQKWDKRVIDIDILFYNNVIIQESNLIIPHPLLTERRFALVPLAELIPNFIHPIFQQTISTLLENCTDNLSVHQYTTAIVNTYQYSN